MKKQDFDHDNDPSKIPVVEDFRLKIQEAFPKEPGIWTASLEAFYRGLVEHHGDDDLPP